MNVLCGVDSDGDAGLFGLREVGDMSDEEAAAAFSSDEEEEEKRTPDVGGIHMLAAASDLCPGPPMYGATWEPGRRTSRS